MNVLKTNLLVDGKTTLFGPSNSKINVCEQPVHAFGNSLLVKTQVDGVARPSYEDRTFVTIMESELTKYDKGTWVALSHCQIQLKLHAMLEISTNVMTGMVIQAVMSSNISFTYTIQN